MHNPKLISCVTNAFDQDTNPIFWSRESPFQMINHGGSWTCTCTHHWLVHQFEYYFNPSRWIFIITLRIWRSKLIPILHFALVKVISISNYKYWRSAKEKLQIYTCCHFRSFSPYSMLCIFLGNLTIHFAVGEMCSPKSRFDSIQSMRKYQRARI